MPPPGPTFALLLGQGEAMTPTEWLGGAIIVGAGVLAATSGRNARKATG